MKPEHVVTIIGVAAAVVVVALFLIAIVVELRRTHLQLVTILGAVSETVNQTDGLDSVTAEIAGDIAAGQQALMECVQRLEQRLGSPEERAAQVPQPAGSPPQANASFSNY
jgi:hypothetical protein